MSEKQQPRPGQATLAGVLIIGGSIVLVLTAWERIAGLHSIEVQAELHRWVERNGAAGLTADGLASVVRTLCLIGAGAATAATILGFQVFQRSSSARVALTALSPLLLVGGLAVDEFFAPMVLAGIALLWLQPTRDWYAGRPWVQAYEQRRAARLARMQSTSPTLPPAPAEAPPAAATPADPAAQVPPPPPPPPARHRPVDVRRPGGLTAVCVLTWVLSSLTVVGLALSALTVVARSDEFFADFQRQEPALVEDYGVTEANVVAALLVVFGGLILWALAAIVLAGLAFAGHNWARVTLAVSAAVAGVTALVFALNAPPLVVLTLLFAVSTWLLLRPDVAQWYQQRRSMR